MHSHTIRRSPLTVLLTVLCGILLFSGPAKAQSDEVAIFGTIQYEDTELEQDFLVPDVLITVSGADGFSGEATTDVDGEFRVVVPGNGDYTVLLDESTLPDGINLRNPDRNPLETNVTDNQDRLIRVPLVVGEFTGNDNGSGGVSFRRVAQLTVEGLKTGLYLAMAAIGLSLIFGTTGLVNFAHGEMVTFGMIATYFFNFYGLAGVIGFLAPLPGPLGDGVHLVFAAFFGMLAGGALGYLLNRFIFQGARRAGVSLIAQLVMTIGLSILMRYLFVYVFGGGPRTFGNYSGQQAWTIGPVDITPKDLVAMILSVIILVAVGAYLELTRMGKAMRAVADNRELAESTGINVERVIMLVWVAGGALAALGGTFFGLDVIKWDFGFRTLLLVFAAVTLGGLGKAYGALLGSLVIGLAINLSSLIIDAELKNMVALAFLGIILLFRPQGILGQPERIG